MNTVVRIPHLEITVQLVWPHFFQTPGSGTARLYGNFTLSVLRSCQYFGCTILHPQIQIKTPGSATPNKFAPWLDVRAASAIPGAHTDALSSACVLHLTSVMAPYSKSRPLSIELLVSSEHSGRLERPDFFLWFLVTGFLSAD